MKKIISIFLTLIMFTGNISIFAESDAERTSTNILDEMEDIGKGEQTEPVIINEVKLKEDVKEESDVKYVPIQHEETIENLFEFPADSKKTILQHRPKAGDIAEFSVETEDKKMWKSMYSEMFGDDYLKPYTIHQDGQRVTGNTNRMIIEETDLTLPGKNGLDLVLKRKYDNQDYNDVYNYYRQRDNDGNIEEYNPKYDRYIYGFKNVKTNETLYVSFLTEDQMYTYMYSGFHIKPLNDKKQKNIEKDGKKIYYYDFEDVGKYITEDSTYDEYIYNKNVSVINYEEIGKSTANFIKSRRILDKNNYLGNAWNLLIPELYLYRCEYEINDSSKYKKYKAEYIGAFRDIDGNISTLDGKGEYTQYKEDGKSNTYISSYSADDNKYLYFESIYEHKYLYENGPQYNFVVYDNRGLTYYLYNTGAVYGNKPETKQKMCIIAIEDDYGNMIRYEYDNYYNNLLKIIDTYGREVNFTNISNGKQISYYDDASGTTKTIKYTSEIRPAKELDNDSPFSAKDFRRFIVTNQEGESTIYDIRTGDALSYYEKSTSDNIHDIQDPRGEDVGITVGYNIERIIYPTGAESRYRYECIYPMNSDTKIRRGVYAVESSYDIVDGKIENEKNYELSNKAEEITNICMNNSSKTKTVSKYNSKGLAETIKTTPQSSDVPYKNIEYKYNTANNPITVTTDDNGIVSTINHDYISGYPNLLRATTDGQSKIKYTYHKRSFECKGTGNKIEGYSNKIEETNYLEVQNQADIEDYKIQTELTDDKKSIEYEKVIQNNKIKSQIKYAYNSEGNVISVKQWTDDTNNDGKLDDKDNIIEINSGYSVSQQKLKNVKNMVFDVLNADGENEGDITAQYSYNIYGSPVKKIDSYGAVTTIDYDSLNRPVKYHFANGGIRQAEYNTAQKYTIVTDESGIVTKYEVDGFGRNKARYIKNGGVFKKTEEYTYDETGRLAEKTTYRSDNDGTKEVYGYDCFGRTVKKSVYELPNMLLYTENYAYSNTKSESTVTKTIAAKDTNAPIQISTYDKYGRLIKEESTDGSAEDTQALIKLYEYDYKGRKIKETDANGNEISYEYTYDDKLKKQTDAAGNSVSTVYDMAGQVVSETDANGNTTNTEYDKLGRVIKVKIPFNTSNSGETKTYYDKNSNVIKKAVKRSSSVYQTEEYKYDSIGNIIAKITNDGNTDNVTQYTYDKSNRVTSMITGLAAYSTNPLGGAVTSYSYNSLGYLEQIIDPMGQSEIYSGYDYAGNLIEKTDKNANTMYNEYGAYGLEKTYFANSPETKEYTYNSIGQLTGTRAVNADNVSVEENYKYDIFGRVIKLISNDGSEQSYEYDNNSNVTSYKLVKDENVKNSIKYEYNNVNRLTSLDNNGILTSYSYDANGNVTNKKLSSGITTRYTYNKAGLLTYMESKNGSEIYTYSNCAYLLNGLLQSMTMPCSYDKDDEKRAMYFYDNMGRLKNESVLDGDNSVVDNAYKYDLRGNRIKKVRMGKNDNVTETTDYSYDLNNRLISENITDYNYESKQSEYSSAKYYYDANGNIIAKQGMSSTGNIMTLSGRGTDTGMTIYRYDVFNRLTKYYSGSNQASYEYNADNLRTGKTVNGIKSEFVWNGQNLAMENKKGEISTYTYDMTGIHAANKDGDVVSYLKDHHGNVICRADYMGRMIEERNNRMDYDAYGNRWIGDTPDPFGYCGEYLDSESGLIYLRNRYYDSVSGRFITEDPVKDGLNWYSYCGGNPVTGWDPSGYIRAGYDENGNWHDWDAEEFGKDSLIYSSLTTLTNMWNLRPDDRGDIENLANEVRRIGRLDGINNTIEKARKLAPNSANATDVVIAAGDMGNAVSNFVAKEIASMAANDIYGDNDGDGTQHNALKHTMWHALLTRYTNETYSKFVGDAHEFGAEENYKQDSYQQNMIAMDLYNNAKGREIGKNFVKKSALDVQEKELAWTIVGEINKGYIWVVNWID